MPLTPYFQKLSPQLLVVVFSLAKLQLHLLMLAVQGSL
jgi:hypothetical protein